ncbi:MAG TPA: DUF5996 family protein [Candidatus Baltobacteraceae bacterium]|jgi:hypothetical protein|nr:DUF5996 family protein [Candidatus Baltobacteraceae bacterium]
MSSSTIKSIDLWPDIDVAGWAATKRSLHLYAQMLGKIRVALSPTQPNWMFTPLLFTAGGFTTGPIPCDGRSVEALFDVFTSEIVVRTSTGDQRKIALVPARSVAEVYHALCEALEELDVSGVISRIPQEIPDATPFPEDTRLTAYAPRDVQRWFRAATSAVGVFEEWRSHFFGRSGIQLWWGGFDVALILFNGKHVSPPTDRGYLMKYDLDAELMNVGLYFGDEKTNPFFYGYIYPQPTDAATTTIEPKETSWSTTFKEWVLPYKAVREAADPDAMIRGFLDSLYELCFTKAGWNRSDLSYEEPTRNRARRPISTSAGLK